MRDKEKARIYQAKYFKEVWWPKNRAKEIIRMSKARQRVKDIVAKLKDFPCLDCGKRFPHYVMDFDHVRGEKYIDISKLTHWASLQKVYEEVKKCELVCSNCHRMRTWDRQHKGESQGGQN